MAASSQSQVTLRPSNNSDTSFSIPIPIPPSRPPPVPSSGLAFQYITIYHPHYPPGNNILLKLAALDTPTGGLQYGYLTTICGILAGNKWNGWLEGRDSHGGRYSSSTSPHIVLPPGGYDFFLEPSSVEEPYPVVPCFRQWRFPHMELPPGDWQNYSAPASTNKNFSPSNISMALELRDASCRISGFSEGTKVAHVIPKEEGEWHQANNMHVYQCDINRSLDTDLANLLLLRADLHINFDKPLFTIIPKSSGAGDAPQLVVHIVQQSKEYQHMYHNRPVLEWRDIPPEFLFARLAWTVFPWIEGFLSTGLKKRVTIATGSSTETMWLSREEYNVKFLRTRQHSHSRANKRSRSTTGAGRSGDEALESLDVEDVWRKCRRVLSTVTSHALETPNEDMQYQSELSAAPVTGFSTSPDSSTLLASSPTFPDVSDPAGSLSFPPLSTGRPRSPSSPAAQRQSGDLRAVWLQNERARSGMQYAWKEEEAWARQMEGATMNQEEAVRLLRFYGAEFKDE